jgi:aspartyl-tRNA(Asn)/glutamyl-tRNA(Gln) amidotransferase subunit C
VRCYNEEIGISAGVVPLDADRETSAGWKAENMALSREEVSKVALLARLELTDDELEEQAKNFNVLLQQFEMLQSLDVSGIEPTSHSIPLVNVFREDIARPSLPRDIALVNAPESRDGCIVVPRIIEG